MAIESSTTSSISSWRYKNTGKRVVLEVDGRVEVCRVHHFQVPISNAPVRVGSGYRVQYSFIYFPVVVQNTGKRVVPPSAR